MADDRNEGLLPAAGSALEARPGLPLPPSPPSAPVAAAAAAFPRPPSVDNASASDSPMASTALQADIGTPGPQALLEELFPSGSEGGSPPPSRRRPTRSPSREPEQLDDAIVDEANSDGQHERPAVNGRQSMGVSPGPPTPSAADPIPFTEAYSSRAGPSSPEHAPTPPVRRHNASPGPSRPTPRPFATITASDPVPPEPAPEPKSNLPVVSFRIVERPPLPPTSAVAQSYGYNASGPNGGPRPFIQPTHLMRSVDPIEADLMNQVEYDMDTQDYLWVEKINDSFRKNPTDPMPNILSNEFFTIAIDRIEKEWWELTKRIPNPRSQMPSEEEACAICDDADGENSNAIVFCDGCNLAVHQDCYGVPYIPEGQWLCRKCTVSPENPVSCVMCPSEGGAFKQTTTGKWAHLLCAIWIPEAGVGNTVYMEPIDGVEMITKQRWKLKCSLCKKPGGACIQCENKSCYTAFHPTCAREAGLLGSMKTYGDTGGVLKAYCERHIPPALKVTNDAKRALYHSNHAKKTKKSARAYAKGYDVPPPLLPHMILDIVIDYVKRMPGPAGRKRDLVDRIGRYWSLKREARRGAPLLKRLHLEPWTAADLANQKTEEEKEMQAAYLTRTRQDLEQVRMLNGMVLKREKAKQRQVETISELLRPYLKPWDDHMYDVIDKLRDSDKRKLFHEPVDPAEVPEYDKLITRPMSFETIEDKIATDRYFACSEFETDVLLVSDNAMTFNPPGHPVHKAAAKLKEVAIPLLAELREAVLAENPIEQILKPIKEDWVLHHQAFDDEPIPPFPEAEILLEHLGPNHKPIDSLECNPAKLATLIQPLDDGSGQTFLDSLFDYRYEVEPEPEPEPEAEAVVAPTTASTSAKRKGKAPNETGPLAPGSTRIRLRVQNPALGGDTAVRQSSRKRPRETSMTPPPSGDSRRPSLVDSAASETDEDPAVAEKRQIFATFEQPAILPEGTRRRAAATFMPPRPINQALAATQQEQNRKKASQRREKEPRLAVPQSFVPNVKVPKRRPKGDKKDEKDVPPPPAGPTPRWTFDDDSDLSSLSSHVSEVESESETEPLDELLLVEPRPKILARAFSVSSGDDDEVQEVAPPSRPLLKKKRSSAARGDKPATPTQAPRASLSAAGPSRTTGPPPAMEVESPRKTRSSLVPASTPVAALRNRLPVKQSGLRRQLTLDSDESELSAVAAPDEGDDDDDSLFGGSLNEEDVVEGLTTDLPATLAKIKSQPSGLAGRRSSLADGPASSLKVSLRSSRHEADSEPVPEASPSVARTRSNQSAPTPKTAPRAKTIVNRQVPTTARSRKGLSPGVAFNVPASPAPSGSTRSSARRSSLVAQPPPTPSPFEVEVIKQHVASASKTATGPRKSPSAGKGKGKAKAATPIDDDVNMEEPLAAALEPAPTASKRSNRRSSRAIGTASDSDLAVFPASEGEPASEPLAERPLEEQESEAQEPEAPQEDEKVAADAKQPANAGRSPSPDSGVSPLMDKAPSFEGEEEQDDPSPKKKSKKATAVRRVSTGPVRTTATRGRRSLPAPVSADEAEQEDKETAVEPAPAKQLSKAAQRKAAAAAQKQALLPVEPPLPASDAPDAVSLSVVACTPEEEPEPELEEFDEKGRPKRRRGLPKRFHHEAIVVSGSPPPAKRQKVRRSEAAGSPDAASRAEGPEPVKPNAEQKGLAPPPSGVWDDEEAEDEIFAHGTLVWCQAQGHPWYPGEIVVPCEIDHEDFDDEEVPADVHLAYKAARETWIEGGGAPEGRPFLVHFFDQKRFWGTVRPKQLSQLSEDQAHDRALLTYQSAKNFQKAKMDILGAYERAWSTLEPDLPNPLPPWFEDVRKSVSEDKKSKKANKKKTSSAPKKAAAGSAVPSATVAKSEPPAPVKALVDEDVQMADVSVAADEPAAEDGATAAVAPPLSPSASASTSAAPVSSAIPPSTAEDHAGPSVVKLAGKGRKFKPAQALTKRTSTRGRASGVASASMAPTAAAYSPPASAAVAPAAAADEQQAEAEPWRSTSTSMAVDEPAPAGGAGKAAADPTRGSTRLRSRSSQGAASAAATSAPKEDDPME